MILSLLVLAAAHCAPVATDGDSIRLCSGERVRLLGVDAPEMHGCRPRGRHCAPGDPVASRDNLRRLIAGRTLRIERITRDRYGRTIAQVWAGGVNLSCAQLAGGFARYRGDWDNGGRIGRACR